MKKILLSLTAIAGISAQAQTQLHNTQWNLKKVVKNNITYNLPQNSEMGFPVLTFTSSPNPSTPPTSDMKSPICGTYAWALIYDAEIYADRFNPWANGLGGTLTCTIPENIAFTNLYNSVLMTTLYNYQITYANGVKNLVITTDTGNQAFYQAETLGTKEAHPYLSDKTISVYPNPVKEGTVYLKNAERIEWIKLYSTEGRLIMQDHSGDAKMNVSNLLKGGYFMEVKSQSGISRHKFIKE